MSAARWTDRTSDGSGDAESVERPVQADGPFDATGLDLEQTDAVGRLNFESIRVPMPDGARLQIEKLPDGRLKAVHVMVECGRLSVSALAAPKTGRLWPELADEVARSLQKDGARVRVEPGMWGREVVAWAGEAKSRFVGVDGQRWMLYGISTGPATQADEAADILRGHDPRHDRGAGIQAVPSSDGAPAEPAGAPRSAAGTAGGDERRGRTQEHDGPREEPSEAPLPADRPPAVARLDRRPPAAAHPRVAPMPRPPVAPTRGAAPPPPRVAPRLVAPPPVAPRLVAPRPSPTAPVEPQPETTILTTPPVTTILPTPVTPDALPPSNAPAAPDVGGGPAPSRAVSAAWLPAPRQPDRPDDPLGQPTPTDATHLDADPLLHPGDEPITPLEPFAAPAWPVASSHDSYAWPPLPDLAELWSAPDDRADPAGDEPISEWTEAHPCHRADRIGIRMRIGIRALPRSPRGSRCNSPSYAEDRWSGRHRAPERETGRHAGPGRHVRGRDRSIGGLSVPRRETTRSTAAGPGWRGRVRERAASSHQPGAGSAVAHCTATSARVQRVVGEPTTPAGAATLHERGSPGPRRAAAPASSSASPGPPTSRREPARRRASREPAAGFGDRGSAARGPAACARWPAAARAAGAVPGCRSTRASRAAVRGAVRPLAR